MKKTTIFIADDHPVIRNGLHSVFVGPNFSVIGESDSGPNTVKKVLELKPDVLIADISMPGGLDITEIIRRVKEKVPQTEIIIFTMHQEQRYAIDSLRAGATGYVLKGSDTRELLDAVKAVKAGRRFISPDISDALLNSYMSKERTTDPIDKLSEREKEVLRLFAEGGRAKDIADKLGVSVATVKKHKANLMSKLKLKANADLIKIAIKKGIYFLQ